MTTYREKLLSLQFSQVSIKKVGKGLGEQITHKDGSVSAVVTPRIVHAFTKKTHDSPE